MTGSLGLSATGLSCSGKPPTGVVPDCTPTLVLPALRTDILFVIDDSDSMREEQAKVVAQLGQFVQTLKSAPVQHDFQVGVVTTSISLQVASCASLNTPTVIDFPDESGRLQLGKDLQGQPVAGSTKKILSYADADFLQQFQLLIGQGVNGSGQEMGLEAMGLALTPPLISLATNAPPPGPGNKGFLRAGSRLLVIIVSDEDDCSVRDQATSSVVLTPACGSACTSDADCNRSAEGNYCLMQPMGGRLCSQNACETTAGRSKLQAVSDYVDLLSNLDDGTNTGRKRDVFLAVIGAVDSAGNPDRCQQGTDEAAGVAVRYKDAVDQTIAKLGAGHGLISSICATDYAKTLTDIAQLVNVSQTLDLGSNPPDGHLITIQIHHATGTTDTCSFGNGFTFERGTESVSARVTFTSPCKLAQGD
ncbi:MAG TPA: vWA domain-containing protein [Polyangiaceae bacterium]